MCRSVTLQEAQNVLLHVAGHRRPNTSLYLDMWLAVAQEALTGVQDDALDTKKPAEPGASPYAWTVMADSDKIKVGLHHQHRHETRRLAICWRGCPCTVPALRRCRRAAAASLQTKLVAAPLHQVLLVLPTSHALGRAAAETAAFPD